MKIILASVLAVCLASAAFAGDDVVLPPAQYDHPFTGELHVISAPYWEINKRCRGHEQNARVQACAATTWMRATAAEPAHMRCIIVLPAYDPVIGVTNEFLALLMRHEIGHCNGWPADHAGGHYE